MGSFLIEGLIYCSNCTVRCSDSHTFYVSCVFSQKGLFLGFFNQKFDRSKYIKSYRVKKVFRKKT